MLKAKTIKVLSVLRLKMMAIIPEIKNGLVTKSPPDFWWPKNTNGTHIAVNTDGAVKLSTRVNLGPSLKGIVFEKNK